MLTWNSFGNMLRYRQKDGGYNGRHITSSVTHFSYVHAHSTFEGYNPRGGDILVPYNYLVR